MYDYDKLIISQVKENKNGRRCLWNMDLLIWGGRFCEKQISSVFTHTHTSCSQEFQKEKMVCLGEKEQGKVCLRDDLQNSENVWGCEEIGLEGLYLCTKLRGVWGYI